MKAKSLEHRERVRAAQRAREQAGILPEDLDNLIRGYWPSRVMLTALDLDLFTAVGDGASAEVVAGRLKTESARHGNAAERSGEPQASAENRRQIPEHRGQCALLHAGFEGQRPRRPFAHGQHLAQLVEPDRVRTPGTSIKTAKRAEGDWTRNSSQPWTASPTSAPGTC